MAAIGVGDEAKVDETTKELLPFAQQPPEVQEAFIEAYGAENKAPVMNSLRAKVRKTRLNALKNSVEVKPPEPKPEPGTQLSGPAITGKNSESLVKCSKCNSEVPEKDLQDLKGQKVCKNCINAAKEAVPVDGACENCGGVPARLMFNSSLGHVCGDGTGCHDMKENRNSVKLATERLREQLRDKRFETLKNAADLRGGAVGIIDLETPSAREDLGWARYGARSPETDPERVP
jgi:hypothetical protein